MKECHGEHWQVPDIVLRAYAVKFCTQYMFTLCCFLRRTETYTVFLSLFGKWCHYNAFYIFHRDNILLRSAAFILEYFYVNETISTKEAIDISAKYCFLLWVLEKVVFDEQILIWLLLQDLLFHLRAYVRVYLRSTPLFFCMQPSFAKRVSENLIFSL